MLLLFDQLDNLLRVLVKLRGVLVITASSLLGIFHASFLLVQKVD
jgi:hypothetical protein